MYRMLCVATLLCSSLLARADWQYIGGPNGGYTLLLSASQTHCYAFMNAGRGMFHSSNEGLTWDTANTGLELNQLSCLVIHNDAVLAGCDSGLFVSTNHGVSWQYHSTFQQASVSSMAFVRDTLYVMTSVGVFRSHDLATTWEPANDGVPSGIIRAVGDSLFLRSDAGELYHFNPNIREWTHDTTRSWPLPLCIAGNTIFAVPNAYSAILRSVDYGKTWDTVGQFPAQPIATGAAGQRVVLIGKGDQPGLVFTVSTDGGTTWKTHRSDFELNATHAVLAVSPDGFFFSRDYRFQWSSDGAEWTSRNAGLAGLFVSSFAHNALAIYAAHNNGVSRSTDAGITWTPLPDLPPGSAVWHVFAVDSLIFASGYGLWRLGPRDTAWSRSSGDISPSDFTTFDGRYFAGGTSGIGRSSDAGASWVTINTGLPQWAGTVCLVSTDSALIVGDGALFTTTNRGSMWDTLHVAGHDQVYPVTMLSTHDTVYAWDTQIGILRSATHGRTWTVCPKSIGWSRAPIVATSAGLVHAVRDVGIYLSTDGAITWSLIGNSDVDTTCTELIEYDGYLFASTSFRGVWRRPMSELRTGITEQTTAVAPQSLTLAQNYPNPCTASSMITFTLPREETIALDLIDMLGHIVQTVYAGSESAGEHLAMIDTRSLPAGVYYCRLAAAGAVRTIPIAVAR